MRGALEGGGNLEYDVVSQKNSLKSNFDVLRVYTVAHEAVVDASVSLRA